MQKFKFDNKISQKERYLIDYANLKDGSLFFQKKLFENEFQLKTFLKSTHKGLPILFPNNLNYFIYPNKNKNLYNLNNDFYLKNFFRTKKKNYSPEKILKNFGMTFTSKIIGINGLKYKKKIKKILDLNQQARSQIRYLKKKYTNICAFQTRNIPHLGHEEIIKKLLLKFRHVVINPVIGPKKKGDIRYEVLFDAFKFLIKNKYKNKLSFVPIFANMFYAGPYEAIHHSNLRKSFGFNNFVIGRDHAGAENLYKPDGAIKLIKKIRHKIKLNVVSLNGAYLCSKCKKIIIKGDCKHRSLTNISGTEFRKCLLSKKIYKHADPSMQKFLRKYKQITVDD